MFKLLRAPATIGETVRIIGFAWAVISICPSTVTAQVSSSASDAPLSFETEDLASEAELDEGSYQDLVADAQRMLSLRGYDPGPIDGKLGLRTRQSIRSYQEAVRTSGLLDALKQVEPERHAGPDLERYSFEARPTPTSITRD